MDAIIYRHRDGLAFALSLLIPAGLQLLVARPGPTPSSPTQEPIEITMLAPPALEASPAPRPPEPKPVAQPAARSRPVIAATAQAGKVNVPTPAPTPTAAAPFADPSPNPPSQPTPTAAAPLADPSPNPPSQPAPQSPRTNPITELEAAYVSEVRQMLNAIKRYPTGREASLLRPSGSVRVWLVLDRNGQLLDRGIEVSSQSLLLDNAALKTVSVSRYPPFPAELWPGQSQRRFHVDIDFVVPNG